MARNQSEGQVDSVVAQVDQRVVVQLIRYTAHCATFDRIIEVVSLSLKE